MNTIEDKRKRSNVLFYITETQMERRNIEARKYITDTGEERVILHENRIERHEKKFELCPKSFLIMLILTGCIGGSVMITNKGEVNEENKKVSSEIIVPEQSYSQMIDANGFVFADSNKRYLSEEEIYNLKFYKEHTYQELLRYSINEIYARNGYIFEEGSEYWEYYNSYSWYRELTKKDVAYEMMNKYERANIDLLVNTEMENGFR